MKSAFRGENKGRARGFREGAASAKASAPFGGAPRGYRARLFSPRGKRSGRAFGFSSRFVGFYSRRGAPEPLPRRRRAFAFPRVVFLFPGRMSPRALRALSGRRTPRPRKSRRLPGAWNTSGPRRGEFRAVSTASWAARRRAYYRRYESARRASDTLLRDGRFKSRAFTQASRRGRARTFRNARGSNGALPSQSRD